MNILDVSRVQKIYSSRFGGNKVEALKNVSFSVEQGEHVAIMGESGLGKTTLLNILAALDKPTSGSVMLEGKSLSDIKESRIAAFRRDHLGFVFQEFNLLDTFTLEDNIYLPLVLAGKPHAEMQRRIMPIARQLGIEEISIGQILEEYEADPQKIECYVSSSIVGMLGDGKLIANREAVNGADAYSMNNLAQVYFVSLTEYNDCMGTNESLEDGEVLIHCVRRSYDDPQIRLADGTVFTVKKQVEAFMGSGDAAMDVIPSVFLVVNDLEAVCASVNSEFTDTDYYCRPKLHYGFDTELEAEEKIKLAEETRACVQKLDETGEGGFFTYSVECREAERGDFYGTYGGIFYLGMILSIVFILATVLIIYYKQLTEGYEDESRFAIMQKVGMTKEDIRKSINSQMLTVFCLPLAAAVLHLSFAFPMVQKLLALFNLRNVPLMILIMAVSVLVFGVFYGIIYKVTSNAYYAIVSGQQEGR